MSTNPLDSYKDVHPWPYAWTKEINGHVISKLTAVKFLYEDLDFWNYKNHKRLGNRPGSHVNGNFVDIYWRDDTEERLQLPPAIGDHVASLLWSQHPTKITQMVWFGRGISRFAPTWQPYYGPHGQCVDHIHVEFTV